MKPEPCLKSGDIIFWRSDCVKGQFYIVLENLVVRGTLRRRFKFFSSHDGSLGENEVLFSRLGYLSEGFWQFK